MTHFLLRMSRTRKKKKIKANRQYPYFEPRNPDTRKELCFGFILAANNSDIEGLPDVTCKTLVDSMTKGNSRGDHQDPHYKK